MATPLHKQMRMFVTGEDEYGTEMLVQIYYDQNGPEWAGSHGAVVKARKIFPEISWESAWCAPIIVVWGTSWTASLMRKVYDFRSWRTPCNPASPRNYSEWLAAGNNIFQ